ncbi:serine O-acetyltransferase [Colwellia sp. Bg11-28]|uniref:serine O-acetyltransferase n=1 Tax=Colwellia sp. Bg11-28 TaxID=2058305 RepID=UPI000C339AE2|nr:serine O-acetyltransferase [Colwellia sp. Bg11-28]PKH85168.1 serine acetyltransferase [Colwellia sp. Bg11-28]
MILIEKIKNDWINHGKDWTKPGFRALAYHRFGNWRMTVKPKILRAPLSIIYRFLYRRARNLYGIELPYDAQIGQGVIIEHQHGIVVHGNSVIGDNCTIRQGVTIGNRYMNKPTEAPIIGNNVNIGAGAKLLGNITIGDNANIGANAVVIHNVAQDTLYVGFPKSRKV